MYLVFQDYNPIQEKLVGQPPQRKTNSQRLNEASHYTDKDYHSKCLLYKYSFSSLRLPHVILTPSAQLSDPRPSLMQDATGTLLSFTKETVVKAWELKSCKIRTGNTVYCWYRNCSSSRTWEKNIDMKRCKTKGFLMESCEHTNV